MDYQIWRAVLQLWSRVRYLLGLDHGPCCRLADDMREVGAESHGSHAGEVWCARVATGLLDVIPLLVPWIQDGNASQAAGTYSPEPPRTPIRPVHHQPNGSMVSRTAEWGGG